MDPLYNLDDKFSLQQLLSLFIWSDAKKAVAFQNNNYNNWL